MALNFASPGQSWAPVVHRKINVCVWIFYKIYRPSLCLSVTDANDFL